jgi:hypothetical protein
MLTILIFPSHFLDGFEFITDAQGKPERRTASRLFPFPGLPMLMILI